MFNFMQKNTYLSRKAREFVYIKVSQVLYHYNKGPFTAAYKKKN